MEQLPEKKPNTNNTLEQTKANLSNGETWMRAVYMVLFSAFLFFAWYIMTFIILFQFGATLLTGTANQYVLSFSRNLTLYIYQILQFLTYQIEDKPFPFQAFPKQTTDRTDKEDTVN